MFQRFQDWTLILWFSAWHLASLGHKKVEFMVLLVGTITFIISLVAERLSERESQPVNLFCIPIFVMGGAKHLW